jgi:hypothetical protein
MPVTQDLSYIEESNYYRIHKESVKGRQQTRARIYQTCNMHIILAAILIPAALIKVPIAA